jgi:hypothetical protein
MCYLRSGVIFEEALLRAEREKICQNILLIAVGFEDFLVYWLEVMCIHSIFLL